MSKLEQLEQYRDEILKAEIVSLFSLLDKTYADWWKNNKHGAFFGGENSINKENIRQDISSNFKNYLNNIEIDLKFEDNIIKIKGWDNFINENWRNWRRNINNTNENNILQIVYGSCEGINSGIEKGSPKEQIKGDNPFLTNAFGSVRKVLKESEMENLRQQKFNEIKELLKKYFSRGIKLVELRNKILTCFFELYIGAPADSRFPVNDTALWDQAYMATTLFKAKLSELFLKNNNSQDFINEVKNNNSTFKWRILGIQYDKLGLAEKGLKVAHIQFYRILAEKIDDAIKELLEVEYPIGNEIYRDETGIYFLVGEELGEDLNDESNLAVLKEELEELENKILQIFKEKTKDEFYPAIFLTKASRGLMNLGYLLEKAKENFLKANWKKKNLNLNTEDNKNGKTIGVCQVCGSRLVYENREYEEKICEVCYERRKGRIDRWLNNSNEETIWIGELKDSNNRIALVTLKFELEDWLNGDLLNSLLVRVLDNPYDDLLKNTINLIKKNKKLNEGKIKNYIWGMPTSLKIRYLVESWLLERSIGDKWEEVIKSKLGDKIDFEKREIYWNKLNDKDIEFLAELILQFLLRKNPSPARLRRIWENTQEFFEEIERDLPELINVPKWRRKRLIFKLNEKIPEGEYEYKGILFWVKNNKLYLISSIEEFIKTFGNNSSGNDNIKKYLKENKNNELNNIFDNINNNFDNYFTIKLNNSINLKKYNSNENSNLNITLKSVKAIEYKPYFSIIKPTPISYQFSIPAKYVPNLIDRITNKYNENFKFVYGKLPLHIGVVVQNYKSPLYIGINALRKIRNDTEINYETIDKKTFCEYYSEKMNCRNLEEIINNVEDYYSLYWNNNKEYNFYIKPEDKWKKWISTLDKFSENETNNTIKVGVIPNTFDFEYLDSNIRRNDINYLKGKRTIPLKENRPYWLEDFKLFKEFKDVFKDKSAKIHKLILILYTELSKSESERSGEFLASAIINTLELKKDKKAFNFIKKLFKCEEVKNTTELRNNIMEKIMEKDKGKYYYYILIDMFEFWYSCIGVFK